ncbi:MAG: hypothetical protein ACI33M_01575 [Lysinibacillus sp.]
MIFQRVVEVSVPVNKPLNNIEMAAAKLSRNYITGGGASTSIQEITAIFENLEKIKKIIVFNCTI